MAYHGYIPYIQNVIASSKSFSILEIGIDRGVTLLPLVVSMASACESFGYVGVDVKVQEALRLTINYMPQPIPQRTFLIEGNSLNVLPNLVSQSMKFDLILLDGDHNYHTVSNELKHIDSLLRENGVLLIDDYDGKWSNRDLFYSEREGYEDNKNVTGRVETEQHGVKPAVDEWLTQTGWHSTKLIQGEPLLVTRNPLK